MDWSGIPSLSALRAFEAAARHQTLSAAARELNVTHAAIAQHVRSLEADFAVSLLVRQGRGVTPTAAGLALALRLGEGFREIAGAVEDLRVQNADRPLNITVTPSFAANWLMPRIGEFWTKYPGIQLSINPSTDLMDLRQDGFDLGVRYGEGSWPRLEAELLTSADFQALAHPDLVQGRTVKGLVDLTDLPWLLDANVMERRRIFEQEGIQLEDIRITTLNTNDLTLSAAVSGLGVTFQPASLVERELRSGQLVSLYALREKGIGYHMVTVPGRTNPSLRTFMSWLRKKAGES